MSASRAISAVLVEPFVVISWLIGFRFLPPDTFVRTNCRDIAMIVRTANNRAVAMMFVRVSVRLSDAN